MTNGGDEGASGGGRFARLRRDSRAIAALAFIGFGFVYMVVNAVSLVDQRRALGRPIAAWEAWAFEGTSYLAWLLLLPMMLWVASGLAGKRPSIVLAGHVAGCLLVSLAHTGCISVLRTIAFAWAGLDYAPNEPLSARLWFELRKDVITYVSVLAVFLIARRLVASPELPAAAPMGGEATIELREGSRVVYLRPHEIDWVSAAGNYVELHGAFGSDLARRTMADIEAELQPHGFVRIHRSRLVRAEAIAAISTRQSGDFDVELRSGAQITGSRRFRQNLRIRG